MRHANALATAVSAVAEGAEQQRDVVVFVGADDFELDRHLRVEVLDLLLSEIAADVEGEAVAAGVDGALGEQAGDSSVVIGEGATEKLPRTVGVAALQRHADAGGGAAQAGIEDVGSDGRHATIDPRTGRVHSQAFRVCGQITVKSFRLTAKDAKDAKGEGNNRIWNRR